MDFPYLMVQSDKQHIDMLRVPSIKQNLMLTSGYSMPINQKL